MRATAAAVAGRLKSCNTATLLKYGVLQADLLRSYPTLRAEDLANTWAYVRSRREEVSRQIEENEAE